MIYIICLPNLWVTPSLGTVAKMQPSWPWRRDFILSPWSIRHTLLDYFSCFSVEFSLHVLINLEKTSLYWWLLLSQTTRRDTEHGLRIFAFEAYAKFCHDSSSRKREPFQTWNSTAFWVGLSKLGQIPMLRHEALGWNRRIKPTFDLYSWSAGNK